MSEVAGKMPKDLRYTKRFLLGAVIALAIAWALSEPLIAIFGGGSFLGLAIANILINRR